MDILDDFLLWIAEWVEWWNQEHRYERCITVVPNFAEKG